MRILALYGYLRLFTCTRSGVAHSMEMDQRVIMRFVVLAVRTGSDIV